VKSVRVPKRHAVLSMRILRARLKAIGCEVYTDGDRLRVVAGGAAKGPVHAIESAIEDALRKSGMSWFSSGYASYDPGYWLGHGSHDPRSLYVVAPKAFAVFDEVIAELPTTGDPPRSRTVAVLSATSEPPYGGHR
jgi:hypothetical protein